MSTAKLKNKDENRGNPFKKSGLQVKVVVPYAKSSTVNVTNFERYGLRDRVRFMFFRRRDNRMLWMGLPLRSSDKKDYERMAYMIAGRLYAVGATSEEVSVALGYWIQYHCVTHLMDGLDYTISSAAKSAEGVINEWRRKEKGTRKRNTTTLEIIGAIDDGFVSSGAIAERICSADTKIKPCSIRKQLCRLTKDGILKNEDGIYSVVQ